MRQTSTPPHCILLQRRMRKCFWTTCFYPICIASYLLLLLIGQMWRPGTLGLYFFDEALFWGLGRWSTQLLTNTWLQLETYLFSCSAAGWDRYTTQLSTVASASWGEDSYNMAKLWRSPYFEWDENSGDQGYDRKNDEFENEAKGNSHWVWGL